MLVSLSEPLNASLAVSSLVLGTMSRITMDGIAVM
jgi:hypothetical protein